MSSKIYMNHMNLEYGRGIESKEKQRYESSRIKWKIDEREIFNIKKKLEKIKREGVNIGVRNWWNC